MLTISSHGSQLPDLNGDEAELDATDRLDETWLLYDRMWIDDERLQPLAGIPAGSSDSGRRRYVSFRNEHPKPALRRW